MLRPGIRRRQLTACSDLRTKRGDDYAARVLPGTDVPAAALCHVWGKAQPPGSPGPNPYTDRVRMVIAESGDTFAGQWRAVRRDMRADWGAAFGGAMPRIAAVAVGADTDNTGDSVDAWFVDLTFTEAP